MLAERFLPTTALSPPTPSLLRRVELLPLCPHYLPRQRLYELLERSPGRRLVLIVAPAGFGKTTLLNAWARETAMPVAWLSPGAAGSHLRAFIHALMTAVQTVAPTVGEGVLSLLLMEHPPSTEFIATAIARALADLSHDLTLVLDGYEAIGDTAVHQLLGTLLDQIPTNVQVVVASRTIPPLPVARLRARGQLTEIDPAELRFQSDEAEALFSTVANGEPPASAIRALNDRLEGWPSLLGLVALRLEQAGAPNAKVRLPGEHADPSSWEDALLQLSDRDIEAFLLEEILESQPPEVQDFLVRASLVDAFCAELCDTLLQAEMPIKGAPALLDRLERQHLLIESVDDARTWYRCPRVLRDAFRRRLQHEVTPLEITMLRRQACEWFTARGMVDEAIEQALLCGDMVRAGELTEASIERLLVRRDFRSLERRLGRLPPDIVATRPRLILAQAWLQNFLTRFDAIPTLLARLDAVLELNEHGLAHADIDQLQAEAAVIRALVAMVTGDGQQVVTQARRAYDILPRFSGHASCLAAASLGIGRYFVGEADEAIAFLESTWREAPGPVDLGRVMALCALALTGTMAARPKDVVRWASQLVHDSADIPELGSGWGQYLHGLACYELNQLSEARDLLLAADRHRDPVHRLSLRNTLLSLAMVEQASGDLAAAGDTLRALGSLHGLAESPGHLAVVRVLEASLAYAHGDVEAARDMLAGVGAEPLPIAFESISGSPSLVRARVLIGLGSENDLAEAARLLDALAAGAASINDRRQMIGVRSARALLCQSRGDADGALRFLEQAIALAAPEGLVRTFVDLGPPMQRLIVELDRRSTPFHPYLAHLLAAFSTTAGSPQRPTASWSGPHLGQQLAEPLTWREAEVLQLLDARLSNQEIAGELVISTETVKKHTSNIYQKLQVTGRRAAVARSYALGILPAATQVPVRVPDRLPAPFPDQRQV